MLMILQINTLFNEILFFIFTYPRLNVYNAKTHGLYIHCCVYVPSAKIHNYINVIKYHCIFEYTTSILRNLHLEKHELRHYIAI